MSKKKPSYGEYIVLGINKGLTAFLISFILCLLLSLLLNLHFYNELIMLTVGSLGEATQAGGGTILRMAVLILGLSFFQTAGKFQLGLLLLAAIPILAFLTAGLLFRVKKKEKGGYVNLLSSMIIDGLAGAVCALFLFAAAFLTKGELFGLDINFASLRNLGFSFAFSIFIQFILGIDRSKSFASFTPGLLKTRSLIWLSLGFSALTGILYILYYLTPFLKSFLRILVFSAVFLPNLAAYLSFILMGLTVDLADSLGSLKNYLNLSSDPLMLSAEIRVVLVVAFILLVFILLIKMPSLKYWHNLLTLATGFSLSMLVLAAATRIDLGYVKGALNVSLSVSPLKAFAVPFVIILLDGLLLRLLRQICREIYGDSPRGPFASFFCGREEDYGRPEAEAAVEEAEKDDREAEEDQIEVDIWKDLAARQIPEVGEKTPKILLWREQVESFEKKKRDTMEKEAEQLGKPEVKAEAGLSDKQVESADFVAPVKEAEQEVRASEPVKEVDISLFPSRRKRLLRDLIDFSDMEDEPSPNEYEAEEVLADFTEREGDEEQPAEEEAEQTRVMRWEEALAEELEKTISYRPQRRRSQAAGENRPAEGGSGRE